MVWTNLTDYENVTGLASGLKVANELSGGLFGPIFILAIGVIVVLVLLRSSEPSVAVGVPMVLCSLLSLLGWAVGIISGPVTIMFFIFGLIGLALLKA